MKLMPLAMITSCSLLAACGGGGGGGSSSEPAVEETSGVFLDSAVANLSYTSPSYSGVTTQFGGFDYKDGETTTFSYLGLTLGSVTVTGDASVVTPLELIGTTDTSNQSVRNLLVLLQSFDLDQDPSNGIELNTVYETDLSSINVSSDTFSSDLTAQLTNDGASLDLVNEEDAVGHFETTLAGLDTSSLSLTGTWDERSAGGEIASQLTFSDDGTLTALGFDNCPDNDEFIAATAASAQRNCSSSTASYRWELSGNTIIISNSEDRVLDRCTILNSSAYMFEASCLTDEYIHFERQISELGPALIAATYRSLESSGTSYSVLTFGADQLSGGYEYISDSSDPSDTGTFSSWSASGTSLTVTGVDGASDNFSTTFTLEDAFNGALAVDSGDGKSILIPDFNASLVTDSLVLSPNFKVFDALTGKCEMMILSAGEAGITYNLPADDETCDPYSISSSSSDSIYSISTSAEGAVLIETTGYEKRCHPIDSLLSDDSGRYWFMACATDDGSVSDELSMEIWYNAY